MGRPLLISILGPTAVGKTSLSIQLAKHFNAPIISCDSRQVYKDISIGTAKPSCEEQDGVPHFFVDTLPLDHEFSAGRYEKEALELITGELKDHDVIIQCGGSGLYARALLEGLDDVPKDRNVRNELNNRYEQKGLQSLLGQLEGLDPACAERIDRKNPQRVIRALEVCLVSGRPYSSFLNKDIVDRPFDSLVIGLRRDRTELNTRIAERCESMMENGWIDEVRSVLNKRELNSLNTVGYKEIFRMLDNELTTEQCKALIIKETQRFAKRQMTWFKALKDIHWIELPNTRSLHIALELTNSMVHR